MASSWASIAPASPPARNSTNAVRTRADCSSSAQAAKNVDWPTNASRSGVPARGVGYGPGPKPVSVSARSGERMLTGGAGKDRRLTRGHCTLLRHGLAGADHPRDAARDPRASTTCATAWPLRSSRRAPAWLDLGCGAGVAAADALGGEGAARAVLVDADQDAVAEAARAIPAGEAVPVVADLADDGGLAAVRDALGDARDGVATCFEVIEHLERFTGVIELLVELAEERGFTVLLSVPNDAFWPIESPWHATMWGEGSFEELRRLLPADHVVARQVPLQGSAIVLDGAPPAAPGEIAPRRGRRPLALHRGVRPARGRARAPRRRHAGRPGRAAPLGAHARGEPGLLRGTHQLGQREFREWRGYMNQLEGQLGREPTTTPLDFP